MTGEPDVTGGIAQIVDPRDDLGQRPDLPCDDAHRVRRLFEPMLRGLRQEIQETRCGADEEEHDEDALPGCAADRGDA